MGKMLITGGAGFIGSNLARKIKPSILLDWREPGYLFKKSGESELIYDGCEFVHGDVRKMKDLEACLDHGEIDSIIHLAAIPGIRKCEEDPKLAREVNVDGTKQVLEFARKNDISRVLFASSAGVYGEIKEKPITEEHPLNPLNLYSETKVKGEEACEEYSENYGLQTIVMRMSNVYGPGFQVKPNLTVIPIFILRALSNQPLQIYGDGEQTRDFVHAEDIRQGLRKALKSSKTSFQVYNIGSGITTSVNELARITSELMEELYDREVKMEHVKPPEWRKEAKEEFDYSIEKISEESDYEPEFSLKDGITQILGKIG